MSSDRSVDSPIEFHQSLMTIAEKAARAAGELVKFPDLAKLAYEYKGSGDANNDVVTQNDISAERLVIESVLETRPDDGILGEESERNTISTSGVTWLIDPIDGTLNYKEGFPEYAISVAAVSDSGEVLAAAVATPELANGQVFTAFLGGGAFLDGKKIEVSTEDSLEKTVFGTASSYEQDLRSKEALRNSLIYPHVGAVRTSGCCVLDICRVSCAMLGAQYHIGMKAWDIAAGSLLVAEAGGVCTTLGSNLELGIDPVIKRYFSESVAKGKNHLPEDFCYISTTPHLVTDISNLINKGMQR